MRLNDDNIESQLMIVTKIWTFQNYYTIFELYFCGTTSHIYMHSIDFESLCIIIILSMIVPL